MRVLLSLLFSLALTLLFAQDCQLELSGRISDSGTGEALAFASVYVEESKTGVAADEAGFFVINGLCPGEYHLLLRHVGCEPERIFLRLSQDTTLDITLQHHAELIDEVTVHGSAADNTTETSTSLNEEAILRKGDTNLGQLLDGLSGVSALRNGTGISKPVIHGLFGNRIGILNNGVAQSGQQWGNDHAPEIDPFVADHLSVVKGVAALEYAGGALGGVVLVEPDKIEAEPHLHGHLNYLFATNGRGHTLNTRLEKAGKLVNWRLNATARTQGDNAAPDYLLNNTGRREWSTALQLEKTFSDRWDASVYLSQFNTEIGLLRGSHIGNLTDLEQAISRPVPFFTETDFSYSVEAPKQSVQHSLLKIQSRFLPGGEQKWTFTYAGQLNQRREFDVRRGELADRASLSLQQWQHYLATEYSRPLGDHQLLKAGVQTTITINQNQAGTGILPLIPDYNSVVPAFFTTLLREKGKWLTEVGIRYEYTDLRAATISRDLPRRIVRYQPVFHQLKEVVGARYRVNESLSLSANLGIATRAPQVNELYSNGLHQGVSGIEEGDENLRSEQSVKGTFSVKWSAGHHFFLQALIYYQRIEDYIYLQPQPDFRLTIRGAFPVFTYQQTDAELAGLDLLFSIEPTEQLKLVTQYSYLRGTDLDNQTPLVFMPPNRLSSSLEYNFGENGRLSNGYLNLKGNYTFRQDRLNPDQDLLPAPDPYFLLSAAAGVRWQLGPNALRFKLRVDNVLNTRYRDYLNRLRYFADETGRNVVLGLSFEF